MIELHIHLEGSVRPQTLLDLALEQGAYLPTYDVKALERYLRVPNSCTDLAEYLKRFDLAFTVLQEKKAIRRAVYELVRDLDDQGVLYAEIRMIPQYHTLRGLSQSQVVEAAITGIRRGVEDSRRIRANLILCTVRGADEKDNFATIVEAMEYLRRGVAGMDLVGDEENYPTEMYVEQFQVLNQEGIPFCVHAGEKAGPDSIRLAIKNGALRIGHGIHAYEDPDLVELIKERGIALEICPTSNLQTGVVTDIREHPIKRYYDAGVRVTVGTDDMVVCDTTLRKEYTLLSETFGWTKEDFKKMNQYAIDAAFLPSMEKERLRYLLEEIYNG